ncbi:VOC family protein [Pseudoleptotrichia goodfellowii]|uniref:Glyoxalase family protein n=1 Tax=Pseudoleptotrichia goodfellowii TaxID=157692 RepID=A0A510J852_9FUSO|nr:VOC family protein [Pseudoleptotrichia goodfellowii]BBM35236.1 glyoxalase family protein [Pseudoleptotrichia goodfellowii]
MNPKIDHIHITVKDINRAEKFYDKLLPIIGFDLSLKEYTDVPEHEYKIIEYHNKNFSFGIVNERLQYAHEAVNQRKPGALHHLAFHVETKEEVDILYQKILEIPAAIVQPPQYYIEYCKDYYAFFFKDSEGIEYEIVNFQRNKYFY